MILNPRLWQVFYMLEEVLGPLYNELKHDLLRLAESGIGRVNVRYEGNKRIVEIYNRDGVVVYRFIIEKMF